jgi:hypothetical protein
MKIEARYVLVLAGAAVALVGAKQATLGRFVLAGILIGLAFVIFIGSEMAERERDHE